MGIALQILGYGWAILGVVSVCGVAAGVTGGEVSDEEALAVGLSIVFMILPGAALGVVGSVVHRRRVPCPNCKERIMKGAKICPHCRSEVTVTQLLGVPADQLAQIGRCPKCQAAVLKTAAECTSCGKDLSDYWTQGITCVSCGRHHAVFDRAHCECGAPIAWQWERKQPASP